MKSRIFCFILCCIFLLSLPCLASGSAETDGELVRISGGTTLYADADLTKAIGIFSSDVCVYAGEARASSAGEVIEIIYLRDFIVRYAYIPLLSAASIICVVVFSLAMFMPRLRRYRNSTCGVF